MKIKNLLNIVALLGILIFVTSCNDLDTLPEGDRVTESQKEDVYDRLPERAEAGVNAIFAQFNQYAPNATIFGSTRHNDFGYPSIMLFTDTNGNDVISDDNGYNWTGNSLDFTDRSITSLETQIVWNDLYSMIYASNNVIAPIDPETDDPKNQFFLAQGLSVRAFSYFGLIQLYQFNYKGNESKPGVPIITNENANDVAIEGAIRSTVQEVYDLILSDLNASITLLEKAKDGGVERVDKRYVDLAVAYGIRARVHLTMHKYKEAAEDAQSAINATSAKPASISDVNKPTFYDASEGNWMWAIIIAETDRVVTSGIVNWYSHMGSFNGNGYSTVSKGKQINKALFNSIPDSDVRKNWWINADKESAMLNKEQRDFIASIGYAPYTQVKFGPYKGEVGTSTNANDLPLMRIEEMYLIKAEAEAMSGGNGKGTLETFVKTYRDPSYATSATSPEQIQEEVFQQRRVELWGEGLNWYDIMRLNKGVDRRGGGYPNATMVFNIPAGDGILIWRIPEAEIEANPALSEGDNNPAASAPSPVKDKE